MPSEKIDTRGIEVAPTTVSVQEGTLSKEPVPQNKGIEAESRPQVNAEDPASSLCVPKPLSAPAHQNTNTQSESISDAQEDVSVASENETPAILEPSTAGSRRSSANFVCRLPRSRRSSHIENTIHQLELRNRERGRRVSELEADTREAEKALNESSLSASAGSNNTSIISGLLYGLEAARLELMAAAEKVEQAEKARAAEWAKYMQEMNDVTHGRGIFAKFYEGDIDLVSFLELAPSPDLGDSSVLVLSDTRGGVRQSLDAELTAMGLVGNGDPAERSDLSIELNKMTLTKTQGAALSSWCNPKATFGSRTHSKSPSMLMRRELMRMGTKFFVH